MINNVFFIFLAIAFTLLSSVLVFHFFLSYYNSKYKALFLYFFKLLIIDNYKIYTILFKTLYDIITYLIKFKEDVWDYWIIRLL